MVIVIRVNAEINEMKFYIVLLIVLFANSSIAGDQTMKQVPGKLITIESLHGIFDNIKKETDWDTSDNMLWGYFFTHNEPQKLEKAKELLISKGYKFIDIYLSEKDDPSEPDMFWLHVEKVEIHSPESLDKRNDELYFFAHELGIDSYDGMDVGPVSK
jgi:hypothetical protein